MRRKQIREAPHAPHNNIQTKMNYGARRRLLRGA